MTIEEFDAKLKQLNIKKAEFATIINMNKGSVYNWGTTRIIKNEKQMIQIPDWVEAFFEHYEKSLKYDQIKKLLGHT